QRYSECPHVKHCNAVALADEDAIHLLQSYAAEQGIEAIPSAPLEDLRTMVHAAGCNPLIIKWITNQLAALPTKQVLSELSHVNDLASDLYNYIFGQAWEDLSASARQVLVTMAH